MATVTVVLTSSDAVSSDGVSTPEVTILAQNLLRELNDLQGLQGSADAFVLTSVTAS